MRLIQRSGINTAITQWIPVIDNSIIKHKLFFTNHTGTVVARQVALHSAVLDKLLLVLDTPPY